MLLRDDHFCIIFGSYLYHFGIIVGSFWDNFGILLRSFWDHFGIALGSLWDLFGIVSGSFWDRFGIVFGWGVRGGIPPKLPINRISDLGYSAAVLGRQPRGGMEAYFEFAFLAFRRIFEYMQRNEFKQ